jgi:pimeloyl-ACP methyl ester carboxylesterase
VSSIWINFTLSVTPWALYWPPRFSICSHAKLVRSRFYAPSFAFRSSRSHNLARVARLAAAVLSVMPFHAGKRRHVDYARFPNSGDWNLSRILADTRNTGLHAYLYTHTLSQIYAADSHDGWNNIDKRCLIIHGKRDSLIPVERAALLAKEIARCEFVVLEDADHILVLNKVVEVGQALERFIDSELDTHS